MANWKKIKQDIQKEEFGGVWTTIEYDDDTPKRVLICNHSHFREAVIVKAVDWKDFEKLVKDIGKILKKEA